MTITLGVTLFEIVFFIYLLSAVCYIWHTISAKELAAKAATILLGAGWLLHSAVLVVRSIAAARPPFLNLYEYVISLTWGVVLLYLVCEFKTKSKQLGSFIVPLIAVFAYLAIRLPSEVNPTMPALRSAWRVPHIATAILAYSAFAMAFGLAFMYLLKERTEGRRKSFWSSRLPSTKVLDQLIYRALAFGFMMQTALLITGAIWAQFAWGRYWGWDPKETWSLITWLIYATFLHMRLTRGWRGHRTAILCIVGFLATMFTLFGVTMLLPGLHSYAGSLKL